MPLRSGPINNQKFREQDDCDAAVRPRTLRRQFLAFPSVGDVRDAGQSISGSEAQTFNETASFRVRARLRAGPSGRNLRGAAAGIVLTRAVARVPLTYTSCSLPLDRAGPLAGKVEGVQRRELAVEGEVVGTSKTASAVVVLSHATVTEGGPPIPD
jgi:hypothetical protein